MLSQISAFVRNFKVRIFWEGHKIWKNLPFKIWRYWVASSFKWKIFSNFLSFSEYPNFNFIHALWYCPRTMDTQWRHKSKISEKLGQCGRQNMLQPYLKIWKWEWIFGCAECSAHALIHGYIKIPNTVFVFLLQSMPYDVKIGPH